MNINDNSKRILDYRLNKMNNYRNNNDNKNYNNVSRHDIEYKSNNEKNDTNPRDIIDTKYKKIININNNKPKNLNRNNIAYLSHRNVYLPYETQTNQSNYKRIEKPKVNNYKPYNIKQYIPLTKNYSTALLNNNYSFYRNVNQNNNINNTMYSTHTFRNVYPNNNTNTNTNSMYSTHTFRMPPYKGINDRRNYNTFTFTREMKLNDSQQEYNKEALRKGVTTVVQHYSGIKERLNNTEVNTLKIRL